MAEKFLIFDADKSLSTLGTPQSIVTLSGFPEVPVTGGINQVASIIGIDNGASPSKTPLFVKKTGMVSHPLFPATSVPTLSYEKSPLATTNAVGGIVIDTISHIFGQDMRILEAKQNSKQLQQQDWGTLERSYLTFLEGLKHLPCWTVVNCHTAYEKSDTGLFYYYPMLKGKTKDRIREFFDVVVYTKTSSDKKSYTWQTFADNSKMAKDRIGVLDPNMPQDLSVIIKKYREKGHEPKILVIGESGTGKTKALESLNKL